MRLRAQLLLSAVGTAFLCGALGTWLLADSAARSAQGLLDGQIRIGEQALSRQWRLRRAERRCAYTAIARQADFLVYLGSGDRAQLRYFAQTGRQAGADVVAVVDRGGTLLASDGEGASLLADGARRGVLRESGALLAVAGALADVYRIPVAAAGQRAVGYLIAANRIDPTTLRSDAEPFGVAAAVMADGVFVSTLPRSELGSTRWREGDPRSELPRLRTRYRVSVNPFFEGKLLLAVPLTSVQSLTSQLITQVVCLVVLILIVAAAVALVVLERITNPIEQLQRATEQLGQGRIVVARTLLNRFFGRSDEIGALSREFGAAVARINAIVVAGQTLSKNLNAAIGTVDDSASAVASGAAHQEARLREVNSTLGPLSEALEFTAVGLADARNLTTTLSLAAGSAEHAVALMTAASRRAEALLNTSSEAEPRAYRTASVMQQVSQIGQLNNDQRDTFRQVRDQVLSLKKRIEESLDSHTQERSQEQFLNRAVVEIGGVAQLHAKEAESLRTSAEQLRHDITRLNRVLALIDTRPDEEQGPAPGALPSALSIPERGGGAGQTGRSSPSGRGRPSATSLGRRPSGRFEGMVGPSSFSARISPTTTAAERRPSGRFEEIAGPSSLSARSGPSASVAEHRPSGRFEGSAGPSSFSVRGGPPPTATEHRPAGRFEGSAGPSSFSARSGPPPTATEHRPTGRFEGSAGPSSPSARGGPSATSLGRRAAERLEAVPAPLPPARSERRLTDPPPAAAPLPGRR